jgi:pyruvate,water dikinase
VSCAEGDTGFIYDGELKFTRDVKDLGTLPTLGFKIMMNVGNPSAAFEFGQIPNEGIGLARLEFVINNAIGIHPKALLNYGSIDADTKAVIDQKIKGYASPEEFYVSKIAEGVATLAASVYPKRIIVRLSDFKSNEYKSLVGGDAYEPDEENPMIGFRGCGRYADPAFEECFALELKAMKRVREDMGMTNVELMIPFVRTLDMAADVLDILKKNGLERGVNGLKVNMMAELPSNVFLAEEFLEYFDGFSIGSNDLTQLTLGLDRDSGLVAQYFDEENPAVMKSLSMLIQAAKKKGKYVGICGQGPSDKPELAKWLMDEGIDSVSLNPDSVIPTWLYLGGEGSE